MAMKRLLKLLMPPKWRRKVQEQLVSMNVTHLCGPKSIRLSRTEAVVTCVVRNGEFYIEPFIRHYSQMGFRHIFFLDNGSSDQTISIAKKHKNVSVCESALPIDGYQALFKKYLAQTSAGGGWCLDADIDEFFDYPFSDVIGLREFLEYLNKNHYTAVITQLLDMFSDRPLSHLAKEQEENLTAVYQYYDITDVKRTEYHASEIAASYGHANELSNGNAALYWGGIRKTLYGNDCLLTKHSLFLPGKRLELFPHVHFVNNARLADVSCVMLHYKLTGNALRTALQNKERFSTNSSLYGDFVDLLMKKPTYQVKQNTAVKFRSVRDLVETGLLFMSEDYCKYARALAEGKALALATH
jgi:hypothetical protein